MTMYEKLIQLRKDHDLTQEALAEQLAISRQAIIKWERGEAVPSSENLVQLARFYQISVEDPTDYKLPCPTGKPLRKPKPASDPKPEPPPSQPAPPRWKRPALLAAACLACGLCLAGMFVLGWVLHAKLSPGVMQTVSMNDMKQDYFNVADAEPFDIEPLQ